MEWSSKINKTRITLCGAIFLLLLSGNSAYSQEDKEVPGAGSPERRTICEGFADMFVLAHQAISEGESFERVQKELEIAFAGQENGETFLRITLIGASLAEQYVKEDRNADDLKIDFMHPCITTAKTIDVVAQELWLAEMPSDHPLRTAMHGTDGGSSPSVESDGSLAPKSYREFLGDEFAGTVVVTAYDRRKDGIVTGCGYEFSHMQYDYVYSQGRPVKLSGSINLMEHPVSYLSGLIKIKGEDMVISLPNDGSPAVDMTVFEIDNLYLTLNGEPIMDDVAVMECEDPDYTCQTNFQWDKIALALSTTNGGLGYRRAGGGSDVTIRFDWSQPENSARENMKIAECVLDLASTAKMKLEGTKSEE